MNFIKKIQNLNNIYSSDECGTRDEALLYDVHSLSPLYVKHIVFKPMPVDVMQTMIDNYKRIFPRDLLDLYRTMNGADLFWKMCALNETIKLPRCQFSIYGIPLTYDRRHIEPLNIAIEDLNRPEGIPDTWLKFASYKCPKSESEKVYLFADTESTTVYAVDNNDGECSIVETWPSIDECLCSIYDMLEEKSNS